MVRIVIAGLLTAVVLVVVADYFLPKEIQLARSISVEAPPAYLFEEINNLEKWPGWAYWVSNDPDLQVTYGDKRIGIGAESTWEGRRGSGTLSLHSNIDNEMVRADIKLGEKGIVDWTFEMKPDSIDSTKTLLTMKTEHSNGDDFLSGWRRLLVGTRLATALDHNLRALKRLAEMKPRFSPEITLESIAPSYYISIVRLLPESGNAKALNQILDAHESLRKVLRESGIPPAGSPFCRFTSHNDSLLRLECGIFVSPDARVPASQPINQLYSGYVVRGIDHGAYDDVKETHAEVQRYIRFKEYQIDGDPWEVYASKPADDTSRWVTEVYYPVVVGE